MKNKIFSTLKILGILLFYLVGSAICQIFLALIFPISIWNTEYSVIIEQLVFSLTLIIMLLCIVKLVNKEKISRIGILFTRKWSLHWLAGLGIGALSVTLVWAVITLLGGYRISLGSLDDVFFRSFVINLVFMLFVGYNEETLCRGLMSYVGRRSGRIFSAVIIGLVFSIMHIFNPGYTVASMVNTFLVALILSQLAYITGDLWLAIGFHTAWNFVMSSILGVNVSGISAIGLLNSSYQLENSINGGTYGLESSIVCTLFFLAAIVCIELLIIRKGHITKAPVADFTRSA